MNLHHLIRVEFTPRILSLGEYIQTHQWQLAESGRFCNKRYIQRQWMA
jgi:hypothetical protein